MAPLSPRPSHSSPPSSRLKLGFCRFSVVPLVCFLSVSASLFLMNTSYAPPFLTSSPPPPGEKGEEVQLDWTDVLRNKLKSWAHVLLRRHVDQPDLPQEVYDFSDLQIWRSKFLESSFAIDLLQVENREQPPILLAQLLGLQGRLLARREQDGKEEREGEEEAFHAEMLVSPPFNRVVHVGRGAQWRELDTKSDGIFHYLKRTLEKHPEMGARLIAFADSHDVFWGGCGEDLGKYYWEATEGKKMLVSAEFGCFDMASPPGCAAWPDPPSSLGIPDPSPFLNCSVGTVEGPIFSASQCSPSQQMKFLNSGVWLGTYRLALEMMEEVDASMASLQAGPYTLPWVHTDQAAFHMWCFLNKPRCEIDFPGRLALNLYRLSDEDKWRSLLGFEGGKIRNRWLGREVCFLHFPGSAKMIMKEVEEKQKASLHLARGEKKVEASF